MADPVTAGLGALSLGGSILGGIAGASSSLAAGKSQQQMAMFQAAVAQKNAAIAEQNAQYAVIEGEQQASLYGMGAAQRKGQIVAAQGASGLDVGSGSAKDVQTSQDVVSRMDMNQIRMNAAKTAYDYRVQKSGFQTEAMGDILAGQNVMKAAKTNAMASIIGGATSVADKWLKLNEVGGFSLGGGQSSAATGDVTTGALY